MGRMAGGALMSYATASQRLASIRRALDLGMERGYVRAYSYSRGAKAGKGWCLTLPINGHTHMTTAQVVAFTIGLAEGWSRLSDITKDALSLLLTLQEAAHRAGKDGLAWTQADDEMVDSLRCRYERRDDAEAAQPAD